MSAHEVTSALAALHDDELLFAGKVEFRDASGALVGPAYAYRYVGLK